MCLGLKTRGGACVFIQHLCVCQYVSGCMKFECGFLIIRGIMSAEKFQIKPLDTLGGLNNSSVFILYMCQVHLE